MPVANTTYSYAQLQSLWVQAGGSKAKAPIMAAIALAESGGRVNAVSPPNTNGTIDRGLWQINSVHGSLSTLDPLANAKAAVKIESTQGLKAWTTYSSGAYKKFLSGAASDTSGLPSGSTSSTNGTDASLTGDIGGAIGQGFADAFKAMLQPLVSLFIWGSEIMFGGALMLFGIIIFIMNSNAAKEAKSVGLDAATLAAPEAAPELQAAKKGIPGPTKLLGTRASQTASQTSATRTAKQKQQDKARKIAERGDTSNLGKDGKPVKIKSA